MALDRIKSFGQGLLGLTIALSPFIIIGLVFNLITCEPTKPITSSDELWEYVTPKDIRIMVGSSVRELCKTHGIQDKAIQDRIGFFLWFHCFTGYNHADHIESFANSIGQPLESVAAVTNEWLRPLFRHHKMWS